jgi:hypothetical protein
MIESIRINRLWLVIFPPTVLAPYVEQMRSVGLATAAR